MSVRAKVAWELGILTMLTIVFLCLFPVRKPAVDISLAAMALIGVGLTAGYTRKVVWSIAPPKPEPNPFQRCAVLTLWATVPAILLFLIIGAWIGHAKSGWSGAADRILKWDVLPAFGLYVPWALMQQTLFQFYLFGRLIVLFPSAPRFGLATVTGVAYALVHLPDPWTTLVTIFGGIVWSWLYYQYRVLLPLALSHAALGATFYYWVYGHDLMAEWHAMFP